MSVFLVIFTWPPLANWALQSDPLHYFFQYIALQSLLHVKHTFNLIFSISVLLYPSKLLKRTLASQISKESLLALSTIPFLVLQSSNFLSSQTYSSLAMSTISASSNSLNLSLSSQFERNVGHIPSLTSMFFPKKPSEMMSPLRYSRHYSDDSDRSDSSSPQQAESLNTPLSLVSKSSASGSLPGTLYHNEPETGGSRNTSVIVSPLKQSNRKFQ